MSSVLGSSRSYGLRASRSPARRPRDPTVCPTGALRVLSASQRLSAPAVTGWVVDQTGNVSDEAVEYINRVCDEVNEALKREMTIVVVNSTDGQDQHQFATDLFNHWGVGNQGIGIAAGDWSDNGVLLFFAIKDRKVDLILGDGIDSPKQEKIAKQIIDDIIIPNMQDGRSDSAMYEGMRAVATRIFGLSDLKAPVLLPSDSGENAKPRGKRRRQRGPVTWWPWLAGGGLVGGIGLFFGGRYYLRHRPRDCESCKINMVRLEEHHDDQFLDPGQQLEEHLGSVDYDVWACLECEVVIRLRYGSFFTRYTYCPDCGYVTVHKIEQVLVAANYTRGGKVHVREQCKHCPYDHRYVYRTPKLVKSSSSGGSSSGFGGGSSSSGFGGGSSSGGGASGSW